jgi:hypothetical protein
MTIAAESDVHVDAAGARRFGPADQADVIEGFPEDESNLLQLRPLHAWHGIEVDAKLVGVIDIGGTDRMRMQLEAGKIGHPQQCGRVSRDHFFGRASRRKAQRHYLYPLRPRRWSSLLIEKLAVRAIWIPNQDIRPAARRAQRSIGKRSGNSARDQFLCNRPSETAP